MNFEELKKNDGEYVLNTYARFPLAVKSGKGATCVDYDGKKYIDFSSGIGVNSLGFCDEGYIGAVTAQLNTLQHISNLYYTEPCVTLAKTLCERSGMSKVFFCNSGAEANEGAIKAARKYSFTKYGENRNVIVSLQNSFHGRTVTTLSATGQDVFHNFFFPFTGGFVFAKANDIEDTKAKLTSDVCAVMIELIQGEGGVVPLTKKYVYELEKVCRDRNILLIVDEVQTGIGRTGELFAYQGYGIKPDIVTSAKGLGGGLPLGAVLFSKTTEEALSFGDHGSTFGGNPVSCAGANAVMERLDGCFLAEVKRKGAYLKEKLLAMPHVTDVTGMGMMLGVSLNEGAAAKEVVKSAIEKGVILLTAKAKVRLLPSLTISYEEMDAGLSALEETLKSF